MQSTTPSIGYISAMPAVPPTFALETNTMSQIHAIDESDERKAAITANTNAAFSLPKAMAQFCLIESFCFAIRSSPHSGQFAVGSKPSLMYPHSHRTFMQ